jgi:hypothetical protein
MTTNDNKKLAKTSKNKTEFTCEFCDYTTSKKSNMQLHINTNKHKNNTLTTKNNENTTILAKTSKKILECTFCQKNFNDRAGLWRHKKKCNIINVNTQEHISEIEDMSDKEIIAMLIKENSDFKNLMMEIIKNGTHNTTNNNTNNSHNKTFNLNFFLNEQCKDALNMSEFLSSITIELSDLEHTGRAGFVEGLSNLLLKNLKALDQSKRPIHCSDLKRETLYIKDNNLWEKDDEDKMKLKTAIKDIAYENIKKIDAWTKKYPDCKDPTSRKNDQYLKIVYNSMCGSTEEETEKNLNDIVRNIAKGVTIVK